MRYLHLLAGLLLAALPLFGQKIPISKIEPAGAGASFDGNTGTAWFPGWSAASYPARCTVTLDKPYRVSRIRVFDGTGQTTFRAYAAGVPVLTFPLALYETWQDHSIAPTTAQIWVFEMESAQGDRQAPEIEMYGSTDGESGPTDPSVPPGPGPVATSDRGDADRIGTCGFHWVPLDRLRPFAATRLFISAGWVWRPGGLFVEPFYQAQTPGQGNGLDTYLSLAKAQGLTVVPAINQSPAWLLQQYGVSLGDDHPPIRPGLDRRQAGSWSELANFWWDITARYGRRTR